jgi:hypothetical protein
MPALGTLLAIEEGCVFSRGHQGDLAIRLVKRADGAWSVSNTARGVVCYLKHTTQTLDHPIGQRAEIVAHADKGRSCVAALVS